MLAKVYHLSYYSKIHLFQLVYYYNSSLQLFEQINIA